MSSSLKEAISGLKELFIDIARIFYFWFVSTIFFLAVSIFFLSPLFIIALLFVNRTIIEDPVAFGFISFFFGGIYALFVYKKRKHIGKTLNKLYSSIPYIDREMKEDSSVAEYSEGGIKDFIKNWLIFVLFFIILILLRLIG